MHRTNYYKRAAASAFGSTFWEYRNGPNYLKYVKKETSKNKTNTKSAVYHITNLRFYISIPKKKLSGSICLQVSNIKIKPQFNNNTWDNYTL